MSKLRKDLTLKRLKKTPFSAIYEKFITSTNKNSLNYSVLLSLAVVFINSQDTYIRKLGYRLIVLYANKTKDYAPLYEISINMGFFPIAKFITQLYQQSEQNKNSFFLELNESFMQNFAVGVNYYSFEQKELADSFQNNLNLPMVVVAPTSYGKTDLILSMIKECPNKNICILTPTKSLLAQTKQRINKAKIDGVKKIIIHPEMYVGNEQNILAVLTQERLLKLLRKDPLLSFDYVVVDEAHNLLDKNVRATLLASVIILLEKRNPQAHFKFLTPFLSNTDQLKIKYTRTVQNNPIQFKAKDYIKTERYYVYDSGSLGLYDQFMNESYQIDVGLTDDDASFVKKYSVDKNIVYLNKPPDIEDFAIHLAIQFSKNESKIIEQACKALAGYIHPEYNMINCLQKGIIYHHGSVPDGIRLYVEHLYTQVSEIKYVITNSTLLEGVNLPAERMFILSQKKGKRNLSPSLFKNLIGRVCRFSEIFNRKNGDLSKLEPHIYIIKGKYADKKINLLKFLKNVAKIDKNINDTAENVLLKATTVTDENRQERDAALEFIENYEPGTLEQDNLRSVTTEAGQACFVNHIKEFDIFKEEKKLQTQVDKMRSDGVIINSPDMLLEKIYDLFICKIDENDKSLNNFLRLKYESTRRFYIMFLAWRVRSASFSEMIASFLKYWHRLITEGQETLIFVGRWGDTIRDGYRKLWTDIKVKTDSEKINLAIVRIKEEQDFLDNDIIKFIEVLNDLKMLEQAFYYKIKYGTDNQRTIVLIKNGFSFSLAKRLIDLYGQFISIDEPNNTVEFLDKIIDTMEQNRENQIFINEVVNYIS